MYNLSFTQDDSKLFFKMEGEAAERHGAIGYLRADLGKSGREFWPTWFEIRQNLKTSAFQEEFNNIIDSLRNDGQKPPLSSRSTLESFCQANHGKDLNDRGTGYLIKTPAYSYYFRFMPCSDDYDIYCFVYDNRFLLSELAGKHEMPDFCYSVLSFTGELIRIRLNESGYYRTRESTPDRNKNREIANINNALLEVTPAQEEAMFVGSLFGWDVPGAKPWKYDEKNINDKKEKN